MSRAIEICDVGPVRFPYRRRDEPIEGVSGGEVWTFSLQA